MAANTAERREYYREEFAGGFDLESIIQSEISRSNLRSANQSCPEEFRGTHPFDITDLAERLGLTPRQLRRYMRSMPGMGRQAPAGHRKGRRGIWYSPRCLARLRLVKAGQPDPGPEPEPAPRDDAE